MGLGHLADDRRSRLTCAPSPSTHSCRANRRTLTRVLVDQAYTEANAPIVSDRLARAGIRMAGLLNKTLAAHTTQ